MAKPGAIVVGVGAEAGLVAVATLLIAISVPARATLTPVGDELQVATANESYCHSPRVAIDGAGSFHVVWQSSDPTSENGWDVRTRSFDADGGPRGDEYAVNTYTTGFQEAPVVAITDGGTFVVAWSGAGDGDPYGTFARVLDAEGAPTTEEIRLHAATPVVYERAPSAAGHGDGFLVAWVEDVRVAGVRLDTNGVTSGAFEAPVDEPNHVVVDSLPAGEFVVVWSSSQYSNSNVAYGETGHVEGRYFDSDGMAADGFHVNADRDDPTGYGFVVDGAGALAVSADAAGNFVAAYDSYVPAYTYNVDEQVDGYNIGAKIERYVARASQGAEFVAADPVMAAWADVAMTPSGNVVAVYDGDAIYARALDCDGIDASGGAVQVDAGAARPGERPAVAVNEAGDVVVVWQQVREDGNGFTVVGRRFLLTDVCALCGDADANGRVTAIDALAALRASVSVGTCTPERCDTDGSLTITATDALRILGAAVAADPLALSCGPLS